MTNAKTLLAINSALTGQDVMVLICVECEWVTDTKRGDPFGLALAKLHSHLKRQHPELAWLDKTHIRQLRQAWGTPP